METAFSVGYKRDRVRTETVSGNHSGLGQGLVLTGYVPSASHLPPRLGLVASQPKAGGWRFPCPGKMIKRAVRSEEVPDTAEFDFVGLP